jgi:hypothetical protein
MTKHVYIINDDVKLHRLSSRGAITFRWDRSIIVIRFRGLPVSSWDVCNVMESGSDGVVGIERHTSHLTTH